jgi:hypothetical protein
VLNGGIAAIDTPIASGAGVFRPDDILILFAGD